MHDKICGRNFRNVKKELFTMISVLTLTYKRKNFLEECIYSFLQQKTSFKKEMIVINDDENVQYNIEYANVKIYNIDKRFTSIGRKLHFGIRQCVYNFIYRLDDDDLLTPTGLNDMGNEIIQNPGYNLYHPKHHYGFLNNEFTGIGDGINTGNVFNKAFISKIPVIDKNFGEDADYFYSDSVHYVSPVISMIYRWGMNTYHASSIYNPTDLKSVSECDKNIEERVMISDNITGTCTLLPHFNTDYYKKLPKITQC